MTLKIKNRKELDTWLGNCMSKGHDMISIKGSPPMGATYSDGDPILNPVNVAWRNVDTGEVFDIKYEEVK